MNFAEAAPKATSKPIVNGSTCEFIAIVDAISRFDGPANGIKFRKKELDAMLKMSTKDANISSAPGCPFQLTLSYGSYSYKEKLVSSI